MSQRQLLTWVLHLLSSAKYRVGTLHAFVLNKVPVPVSFTLGFDSAGVPFVVDSSGSKIFLSSIKRAVLYRRGVAHRLRELVDQYGLSDILAGGVRTFVDVGANIGEFSLALVGHPQLTYVAFEPDPAAFLALRKNVPAGILLNKAVSDHEGQSVFYLATGTADSSLHMPTVSGQNKILTPVTTLDSALAEVGISEIDVLKVEAEGNEPEVLRGAKETLLRTSICVVDAGPERNGMSTAPECIEILSRAGFRLLDLRFPRGILVFQKSPHHDTPQPQDMG
jgi:FkbM family methyltransferase